MSSTGGRGAGVDRRTVPQGRVRPKTRSTPSPTGGAGTSSTASYPKRTASSSDGSPGSSPPGRPRTRSSASIPRNLGGATTRASGPTSPSRIGSGCSGPTAIGAGWRRPRSSRSRGPPFGRNGDPSNGVPTPAGSAAWSPGCPRDWSLSRRSDCPRKRPRSGRSAGSYFPSWPIEWSMAHDAGAVLEADAHRTDE